MRAKISRWIVRHVSKAIDQSYYCNCKGETAIEAWWVKESKRRQKLFPLARWLDKEAMTTQMIEESWWG